MSYHVYKQKQKGIPTIIALVLVGVIVGGLMLLRTRETVSNPSMTSSSEVKMKNMVIGNIRDNHATVTWSTEEKTTGYLLVRSHDESSFREVYKENEQAQNLESAYHHVIALNNLKHNTTYYFQIMTNVGNIGQSSKDPFSFSTTNNLNESLSSGLLFGTLQDADRVPFRKTIAIVRIGPAEPLITVTHDDGSYALAPCCVRRSENLGAYVPKDDDVVEVTILRNNTEVTDTFDYVDFAKNETYAMGAENETFVADRQSDLFLQSASDVETYGAFDVVYPKHNGVVPNTKPLFKGVGYVGQVVRGRIEPEGKYFEAKVSDKNQWSHVFPESLQPGKHTFALETTDVSGKKVAMMREFTILKSGEAVLGEATGSAQLTPTVAPTLAITEIPSPTLAVVTVDPTLIPSDISGLPTKPPPVSGSSITPLIVASTVLILIGMGIMFAY